MTGATPGSNRALCTVLAAACVIVAASSPHGVAEEPITPTKPIALFAGGDFGKFYTFLQGRGRDVDPLHVFQVVDGTLRISGEEWGCLTSKDEYRDYRLVVEFCWGDETFGKRAKAGQRQRHPDPFQRPGRRLRRHLDARDRVPDDRGRDGRPARGR